VDLWDDDAHEGRMIRPRPRRRSAWRIVLAVVALFAVLGGAAALLFAAEDCARSREAIPRR